MKAPLAFALCFVCCAPQAREHEPRRVPEPHAAVTALAVTVPGSGGALAPAMMQTHGDGSVDGRTIALEPEGCVNCHADIVAEWKTSAHASASFGNPIYRASVESFRRDTSLETSRFCGGCHDIALMVDGAMDREVSGADPRAHAGVSCLTCHGVEATKRDGNASYTLSTDKVILPVEGDAESLAAHKKRFGLAPLRTPELCGSCHRVFLGAATGQGHHLPGQDDYGAWLTSAYAGSQLERIDASVEKKECRACHMPLEDAKEDVAAKQGKVHSHRFMGGHTWLAQMRDDPEQLARATQFLKGVASIDVAAVRGAGGELSAPARRAKITAGEDLDIEVVVKNQAVGHRFPGGTLDAPDVWIEVVVSDAHGTVIAQAGVRHLEDPDDQEAHMFRAVIADDEGKPVFGRRVQSFRAVVYNTTIAARDAVVVPYDLRVPSSLADDDLPLTVRARLLHRSREPEVQRLACEASRAAKDAAYADLARANGKEPPEACAPQPVTVIAEHSVAIGLGSDAPLTLDEARKLLDHGMAWQHSLAEEIDAARPSLMMVAHLADASGLADAPGLGDAPDLVAAARHQLAVVAARQGRIPEMESWLASAAELAPDHPALAFTRGTALASVWRHADALPWLRAASEAAPNDARGFTQLAVALGSLGEDGPALAAAAGGLALEPRDADLLRVQALSLYGQPEGSTARRQAHQAFLDHRVRDNTPSLRSRCSKNVAGCARERTPAHHHHLVAP